MPIRVRLSSLLPTVLAIVFALLAPGGNSLAQVPIQPEVKLLILAPEGFLPSLRAYADRRPPQVRAEVVSLQKILATTPGQDDAEKVKRWLFQRWNESKFTDILLAGDADVFPVRYMVLDRETEPAFHYAFYPSDLYYADLTKQDGSFESWNASADDFHRDYFGEVRGEHHKSDPINFDQIDYLPEVGVGRWPVSTAAELETVITKSLAYEQAISEPGDNVPAAALVYVGGWVDCRPQIRSWGERLKGTWSRELLFFSPENPAASRHRADDIVSCLNTGCDLVLHAGHGYPDGWDQSLTAADLPRLNNAQRLPIVISAGCSTAYFATLPPYESYRDSSGQEHQGTNAGEVFDSPPPPPANYQTGNHNRTGLGEQLLKAGPNGAVAYFGCNTGSQPCALTLVEGFVKGLQNEPKPRLGSCWQHSLRYYHQQERLQELRPLESWYPPSIFFQGMKFMLFGDPSLPLPPMSNGRRE